MTTFSYPYRRDPVTGLTSAVVPTMKDAASLLEPVGSPQLAMLDVRKSEREKLQDKVAAPMAATAPQKPAGGLFDPDLGKQSEMFK